VIVIAIAAMKNVCSRDKRKWKRR